MSKYGEFEVVGTARLKSKRSNDANVDEEGMREYSYLRCPHCLVEDLQILTANVCKQKYTVIRDHMVVCPSFTGERPTKRGKPSSTSAVVMPSLPNQHQEIVDLKQRMADVEVKHETKVIQLESQLETTNAQLDTVKNVVAQHHMHWGDLARLMGYELPKDPPFLLNKCRELRQLQLTHPEEVLLDYKKNAVQLLEQKDTVIQQQGVLLEQKDATLDQERKIIEDYKSQLATKDSELSQTIENKNQAEKHRNEAERHMDEVIRQVTSLSTRADRLQKERDVLRAKYDAVLKGHEQTVQNRGKHDAGMLKGKPSEFLQTSLEQAHRQSMLETNKRPRS